MSEPSVSRARLENIPIFIKIEGALTGTKPARSIITAPPPSIQACPALRASGSTCAQHPRAASHQNEWQEIARKSSQPVIPRSQILASVPHARPPRPCQQLYAEGKHAEIGPLVDACLPKDEAGNFIASQEKSDVVHDLLAFLAERMLEMNKQKQQEIKGFLGWLESYLGAKVEDLTPKTKLQSYYEHDYESFLAVLKRTARSYKSIRPDGSPLKRCGPSSRDRWANCCP